MSKISPVPQFLLLCHCHEAAKHLDWVVDDYKAANEPVPRHILHMRRHITPISHLLNHLPPDTKLVIQEFAPAYNDLLDIIRQDPTGNTMIFLIALTRGDVKVVRNEDDSFSLEQKKG